MEFKILLLFSLPHFWVNLYFALHSISCQWIPWFPSQFFSVLCISFAQVRYRRVYWIRHHDSFKKTTLVSRSSLCVSKRAISHFLTPSFYSFSIFLDSDHLITLLKKIPDFIITLLFFNYYYYTQYDFKLETCPIHPDFTDRTKSSYISIQNPFPGLNEGLKSLCSTSILQT